MSDWKNNRPKNWKNPYPKTRYKVGDLFTDWLFSADYKAYEAGADAMLEALRQMGTRAGKFIHEDGYVKETPLVVIIPEESK